MAEYRLVEVKDLGGESVKTMMDIDGLRLTTFMQPPEVTANIVHNIKNMILRDDDVMFCSAVKSGKCIFLTSIVKCTLTSLSPTGSGVSRIDLSHIFLLNLGKSCGIAFFVCNV